MKNFFDIHDDEFWNWTPMYIPRPKKWAFVLQWWQKLTSALSNYSWGGGWPKLWIDRHAQIESMQDHSSYNRMRLRRNANSSMKTPKQISVFLEKFRFLHIMPCVNNGHESEAPPRNKTRLWMKHGNGLTTVGDGFSVPSESYSYQISSSLKRDKLKWVGDMFTWARVYMFMSHGIMRPPTNRHR